jgi:hypothetical protein
LFGQGEKRAVFQRAFISGVPRLLLACLAAALISISAQSILAQADISTSTLKGKIVDQNGDAIADASVVVVDAERSVARTAATDADGIYSVRLLQPGLYEIHVASQGFQSQVLKDVTLTVGQIAVRDIELQINPAKEELTVTDTPTLIETERTQQSDTIENRQIQTLPNLSRNFTFYILTLPGISDVTAARVQQTRVAPVPTSGFSAGSANGRTNYVSIDGGENESGIGSLRVRNLSVEAVQEFQVNRNAYAAEYGFSSGTAVNVVTKGGTNAFHGSGYAFYRSQHMAAHDPLNTTGKKAFEQRISPGFTFGGPIKKNRTFFFTSFESLKYDIARIKSYTGDQSLLQPTGAQSAYLQTLMSGPNATATTRSIALNVQAALTTTNYAMTMRLLHQSEGQFDAPSRSYNWTTRIDQDQGQHDLINARFTFARENNNLLASDNVQSPSDAILEVLSDETLVGSWSHIFGTQLVNQVRVQFANDHYHQISAAPQSTLVRIMGLVDFGRALTIPLVMDQQRYQFDDTLSWSRGKQEVKFGVSYRPVDAHLTAELAFGGNFQFTAGQPLSRAVSPTDLSVLTGPLAPPADTMLTSLQAFNLGLPALWQQGFGNPGFQAWQQNLGAFAQTLWRVNPRLVLNIGVRVDYDGEPKPLDQNPSMSPRVGFAWDPFGKGKTVIRGGFGTFYGTVSLQVLAAATLQVDSGQFINLQSRTLQDGAQSTQALWAYGVSIGKLPFKALTDQDVRAFGIIPAPGQPNRRIAQAAADYDSPSSVQASLGVSQQLGHDFSLDVAFLMYHGVHLPIAIEGNYQENGQFVPVPGMPGSDLFGPQLVRIDPTIAQKIVHSAEGNSIYYGGNMMLLKQFGKAVRFRASYTFSKALDDVLDFSGASTPYLPTRRYLDRGLSAYDPRHSAVISGSFESPFTSAHDHNLLTQTLSDITLSPIITLRSGFPFNLYIGRDVNGDLNSTDRPYHAPRNSGIGENFYSVDLRMSKRVYLRHGSEGPRLEFIIEGTNLLNRANYLRVNDVVCGTTAQPGFINGCDPKFLTGPFNFRGIPGLPPTAPLAFVAAGPPRQFQFGLKFEM